MDRPRTPYGTIADRIAATQAREQQPSWLAEPAAVDRTALERLRHCWVTGDEHGQVPALLLEWRETADGWEGRVVRPVLDEYGEWRPCEEWLSAARLEQA